MTPEEFTRRATAIINENWDPETQHAQTDNLMEEALEALGYGEGVKLIRTTSRWYA